MHSHVNLRICLRIHKCLDTCIMTPINVWCRCEIYEPNYKIMNSFLSRCWIFADSVNHMHLCILMWIHWYVYSFMYKSTSPETSMSSFKVYYIISSHIILYYIILYHIISYYIILYYIISYYILYYIILYYIILYYTILYYIMILYYIILYCIILHHITWHNMI